MALSTFVKINSVNNLTDARYCAGMYVNLIGFDVSPNSKKPVSPTTFNEITGWLSGVDFVAEFKEEPIEEVKEVIKEYNTKWVEHTRLDPLHALRKEGYECIYKQDITNVKSVKLELAEDLKARGILLHITSKNEMLTEREIEIVRSLAEKCDVLLGSGITPSNVDKLLQEMPIKGITLTGGDEIKVGLKDFDELSEILEELEVED